MSLISCTIRSTRDRGCRVVTSGRRATAGWAGSCFFLLGQPLFVLSSKCWALFGQRYEIELVASLTSSKAQSCAYGSEGSLHNGQWL